MLPETGVVYKYFDLIDGFIRVRVLSDDEPLRRHLAGREQPPDRREYRSLVVRSCVVGLQESVLPRVRQIYPDDVAAAEDLLYQICVDVNPRLEIHTVSLPAESAAAEPARARAAAEFRHRAEALEARVRQEILGQEEPVSRVCRAVRKAACGLKAPERPIGAFLLVGGTGTGKTELARSLARHLYGSSRLVRIDCSEYALPHETAKLIGAPPGYVGHNEGGTLTEALLEDDRAVVLFDEVEKGHEKLHNMLLQVLDEGRLTDSKGQTVSFARCLLLLTSNVGTSDYAEARSRMGFARTEELGRAEFEDLTRQALRRSFRPELLNRLDDVLVFRSLDRATCARIAELQLRRLRQRLSAATGVRLRWTPRVARGLAEMGYDEEYGAREIRRTVDRQVEEHLSEAILEGRLGPGSRVRLRWQQGKVLLEREEDPPLRRCA